MWNKFTSINSSNMLSMSLIFIYRRPCQFHMENIFEYIIMQAYLTIENRSILIETWVWKKNLLCHHSEKKVKWFHVNKANVCAFYCLMQFSNFWYRSCVCDSQWYHIYAIIYISKTIGISHYFSSIFLKLIFWINLRTLAIFEWCNITLQACGIM